MGAPGSSSTSPTRPPRSSRPPCTPTPARGATTTPNSSTGYRGWTPTPANAWPTTSSSASPSAPWSNTSPQTGSPPTGGPRSPCSTIDHDKLRADLGAAGLSTGDQISATAARRLACQHGILPAVLDSNSQVLDLGRTQRFFTSTQRTAMALAHPECQTRGCTIPAAWCEAHHRSPWVKGGTTDLADGALLCPFHHHRAHDTAYHQAWATDGTVTFTRLRT